MLSKQEIRTLMKQRAAAFTENGESERVWANLESVGTFRKASTVLVYMSLPDEVATGDFISRWYPQKRIVIPLVSGNDLLLKEYSPDKLHAGYCGIPEPAEDSTDVPASEIGFAIIPGQAFDESCNRMGRGKGFYDRLIPSLNCPLAGVAYQWRILREIPTDPWDKPLGLVVTDTGILKASELR